MKSVILVLALAPLLAAFGVAVLAGSPVRARRFESGIAVLLLLLIAVILVWDWHSQVPADAWRATWQSALSRAAFLALFFLFGTLFLNSCGLRRTLMAGLLLLCWLDLMTHMPSQNPRVQPSVYAPGLARAELKQNPPPRLGQSRAMLSPAAWEKLRYNPLPGLANTYLRNRLAARANCNLLDEVPQLDGVFSLTPREVSRVTALLYHQTNRASPALLDFLGVAQTTAPGTLTGWVPRPSAMPLVTAGQQPVFADDRAAFDALSQTNLDLRQTVFLPLEARGSITVTQQTSARVLNTSFTRQRVDILAEAPAPSLVVISQTYYPAWKARVDGRPATLWRADYAFQALQVPAGRHHIQLTYNDRALLAGAVLSCLGLLACAALYWLAPRRA